MNCELDKQESSHNEPIELTAEELFGVSAGTKNYESEVYARVVVSAMNAFEKASGGGWCGILF
jgi:hypothetical protein